MPLCKKCGKVFSNSVVIDGKKRRLSNRSYCLDCHPFGTHPSKLNNRTKNNKNNKNLKSRKRTIEKLKKRRLCANKCR